VTLNEVEGVEVFDLELPAESFLRLAYGRLDEKHTPAGIDPRTSPNFAGLPGVLNHVPSPPDHYRFDATGRFADKPVAWLVDRLSDRDDFELDVLDLRDHPLPFLTARRRQRGACVSIRMRPWRRSESVLTPLTAISRSPVSTTTAIRRP